MSSKAECIFGQQDFFFTAQRIGILPTIHSKCSRLNSVFLRLEISTSQSEEAKFWKNKKTGLIDIFNNFDQIYHQSRLRAYFHDAIYAVNASNSAFESFSPNLGMVESFTNFCGSTK